MKYKTQIKVNKIRSLIYVICCISVGFFIAYIFQNFTEFKKEINLSIVISICALILTFYQFYQIRLHNRLSIKPLILNACIFEPDPNIKGVRIAIQIKNSGLGIANLDTVKIIHNGKEITYEELINLANQHSGLEYFSKNRQVVLKTESNIFTDGYYLKKDESIDIILYEIKNVGLAFDDLIKTSKVIYDEIAKRTRYEILYCSLYNEKSRKIIINDDE